MNDIAIWFVAIGGVVAILTALAATIDGPPVGKKSEDEARLDFLAASGLSLICVKGQWGVMNNGVLMKTAADIRSAIDNVRGAK